MLTFDFKLEILKYSYLNCETGAYLAVRAIQLFSPSIP